MLRAENLRLLAALCGVVLSPRPSPPYTVFAYPTICEDGMLIDSNTGVVLRTHLEIDKNHNGHFCPIYFYNRSWRFSALFSQYKIPRADQHRALQCFEALEKVWEQTKAKYKRTYFLSQRLILQQITTRLDIPSAQPSKRPIADLRRFNAQMLIFNELWQNL